MLYKTKRMHRKHFRCWSAPRTRQRSFIFRHGVLKGVGSAERESQPVKSRSGTLAYETFSPEQFLSFFSREMTYSSTLLMQNACNGRIKNPQTEKISLAF